jgi:hypothetical protein
MKSGAAALHGARVSDVLPCRENARMVWKRAAVLSDYPCCPGHLVTGEAHQASPVLATWHIRS